LGYEMLSGNSIHSMMFSSGFGSAGGATRSPSRSTRLQQQQHTQQQQELAAGD